MLITQQKFNYRDLEGIFLDVTDLNWLEFFRNKRVVMKMNAAISLCPQGLSSTFRTLLLTRPRPHSSWISVDSSLTTLVALSSLLRPNCPPWHPNNLFYVNRLKFVECFCQSMSADHDLPFFLPPKMHSIILGLVMTFPICSIWLSSLPCPRWHPSNLYYVNRLQRGLFSLSIYAHRP